MVEGTRRTRRQRTGRSSRTIAGRAATSRQTGRTGRLAVPEAWRINFCAPAGPARICSIRLIRRILPYGQIDKVAESLRMAYMHRHAPAHLQRGDGDK